MCDVFAGDGARGRRRDARNLCDPEPPVCSPIPDLDPIIEGIVKQDGLAIRWRPVADRNPLQSRTTFLGSRPDADGRKQIHRQTMWLFLCGTCRNLCGNRVDADDPACCICRRVPQAMFCPPCAERCKSTNDRAARRAQLAKSGVHRLRHTFCSHLAMRGAPASAIQNLAGHQDLTTTQRYMHLSPAAIESAIRLLDSPGIHASCGTIVATGSTEIANPSR
jgi:hypothetical protein